MMLNDVNQEIHTHKKPNRLGRGIGSGQGKTSGRGHKGQRARAGYKMLSIFQGGGSPLVRRVPKRGFTNSFALVVGTINVEELNELFEAGEAITPEALISRGILKRRFDLLKILGDGELTKKLTVSVSAFSAAAKSKIEAKGGKCEVVSRKTTEPVKG
jgi:large subunit ribosomal protein L15